MSIAAIIRPGQTEYDEQDRIQGALDLPLSAFGETQFDEILEQLRDHELEQIYTSPTEPCLSTARKIGEALAVPVKELEGLENVDHGLWQGLCIDEIRRKQPKVFKQWHEMPASICPPEGETCDDALARARKSLKKPLKRRGSFAVVSVEPMASLIESIVSGEAPKMPIPGRVRENTLVHIVERSLVKPTLSLDGI